MSTREKKRTAQLNIRLEPDELEAIRLHAEAERKTVTRFVMSAVFDKINGQRKPFQGTLRRMREAGEV